MEIFNNNITNKSTADDQQEDGVNISMDNLYPALIQCFAIIIAGYLAGRFKIISNTETKGLNTFAGTFALPSLIFLSLIELNWHTVNWKFLLSILIAKTIVFVAVIIISLLIARPINFGRAGILGTFCTQSNDFAIGYPIVVALYQTEHPEYASYLYLMAPISLAILNPISYILMEISNLRKPPDLTQERRRSSLGCPQLLERQAQEIRTTRMKYLVIVKTIRSIFLNPILLMTIFGVVIGFTFPSGLPKVIVSVLRVFADSFSATALFLLGLHMVGKTRDLKGSGFLLPGVLILVKLLALPLVTRQTINILNPGENFSETTDLSTFGFLYGTFPAAPGVFVIATQYQTDVDLIASSMVACTFISGPLMFISAKMISLTNLNPADYLNELDVFAFDISIVAILASIWILLIFIVTKRFRKMPQRITSCLLISQLIGCVGVILWSTFGNQPGWTMYLQFALFTIGSYSSRLWTAILAIALLFLQCRSLCFVLKLWPVFVTIAWAVPSILVGALMLIDKKNLTPSDKRNPSFQYGNPQAAITVFLLVMCFIVTVGCLVLHERYKKRIEKYLNLSREVSQDDSTLTRTTTASESTSNLIPISNEHEIVYGGCGGGANNERINFSINNRIRQFSDSDDDDDKNGQINSGYNNVEDDDDNDDDVGGDNGSGGAGCSNSEDCCTRKSTATTVIDIEDLLTKTKRNCLSSGAAAAGDASAGVGTTTMNQFCSSQFNCDGASRQNCQSLLKEYQNNVNSAGGLEPLEYPENIDEHQTMKHIVLLILLLCSMFVGLALSIWTLVMEGMSGIYVELSFLDAFLNFGQSLMVLACFITDTGDLLIPMKKIWYKLWYGENNLLILPKWTNLNDETLHICEQFVLYHLVNCRKTIASDKRWRLKIYRKVFYGNIFIDWLLEVGLAKDRTDGCQYARHLIDGRVLRHINNVYHFHDKNLLYTFCDRLK